MRTVIDFRLPILEPLRLDCPASLSWTLPRVSHCHCKGEYTEKCEERREHWILEQNSGNRREQAANPRED